MRRNVSPETRQEVIGLLEKGEMTRSEIAEKVGVPRELVGDLAKENNIAVLGKVPGHKPIDKRDMIAATALILDGTVSDREIARRLGIPRHLVGDLRKSMKLPPATSLNSRRITAADLGDIVHQLREGASDVAVSRSFGVSRMTVWRIRRREGIPPVGQSAARRRATTDQIDQVFALRAQGKPARDIAATVGFSESWVNDTIANVNTDTYKRSWWDTTPEKRTEAIRQLDAGIASREIAKDLGLPLETIRGIANQHRLARDSLASELLSQGHSAKEVADKLGIPPQYVQRLRHGVPEGTHDIKLNSEEGAVAEDMFRKGYTREDVAEKLGISVWRAHSLANEFSAKTMDSVIPQKLAELVRALNDETRTFTTQELAKATDLPEATVNVVEHEYEVGHIISHVGSPQPGPSHGSGGSGVTYEWVRPLTLEQEVEAIRAVDDGQTLRQAASQLGVDYAAIQRLYDEDLPLVAPSDDLVAPPSVGTRPITASLTPEDKDAIRALAHDGYTPDFIANLLELPLAEVTLETLPR